MLANLANREIELRADAQSYRTLHRQTQEQLDELRSTLLSPTLPEVPGTDVAARHRAALDGLLGDEVNQS